MRTRLLTIIGLVGLIVATASVALAQSADHEGVQALDENMAFLAEKARDKEAVDRKFTETCGGTVDDVSLVVLPRCQGYLSDSRRLDAELRSGIEAAEGRARRAGVYPGTMRDLRRRYDLDDYARPVEEPHRFRQ